MKKHHVAHSLRVVLVLLLFFFIAPKSNAQETTGAIPDSTTIPEDILAQMDLTGSCKVVRVLGGSALGIFSDKNKCIEDYVRENLAQEERRDYFLIMDEKQVLRIYISDSQTGVEQMEESDRVESLKKWIPLELIQHEAILRVAEDIVIHKEYIFMNMGYGNDGWMICFDTNYGPYVFCDCINQYLMPFSVYQSMAQDFNETRNYISSGFASIELIEDFDQKYGRYDLNSKDFFLNPTVPAIVWIVVAIVPVAAALGIGLYVKKRKSRKEGEV